MKRLTLLRHAKSSWDDENLADHDRPLAARGRCDAPRIGERLAARGERPDLILTSTAARALATAQTVADALGLPADSIRRDPALYLASTGDLLRIVAAIDERIRSAMLVGHNPGLTQLTNSLLPELELTNLPTAGVVAIDCATDRWQAVDRADRTLRFLDYPKNTAPPA